MAYMKAGISIIITTWENDGDNSMDKSIHGLSKECALAIGQFCKLFKSKNARPMGTGFGNMDRRELDIDDLVDHLPDGTAGLIEKETGLDLYDIFCKLIGTWCDGEYVRVFEKLTYLEVPVDINEISLS